MRYLYRPTACMHQKDHWSIIFLLIILVLAIAHSPITYLDGTCPKLQVKVLKSQEVTWGGYSNAISNGSFPDYELHDIKIAKLV